MLIRLSRKTLCGFALAVLSVALTTACGSGGGNNTGAGAPSAAMGTPAESRSAIRQNWEAFFDGATPAAKRVSLLENGDRFAKEIAAVSSSPLAKQAKAQVTSVTIDGPTTATVTYSILLGTTPVLPGVRGKAVFVGGTWRVGMASFCQLATVQGVAPKACSTAGK